ncbi:MAG: oxidoreductase-like domain-containing protein [Candidatus Competibacteraceae bacterium]
MSAPETISPPPPVPPKPPVPGECCERGCERCMWVYYYEAQQRYEAAAAEWQQRYGCPNQPNL